MEIIYFLIPISLLLLGVIVGLFFWSVKSGQFDDLEGPAHRILMDDKPVRPNSDPESKQEDQPSSDSDSKESR